MTTKSWNITEKLYNCLEKKYFLSLTVVCSTLGTLILANKTIWFVYCSRVKSNFPPMLSHNRNYCMEFESTASILVDGSTPLNVKRTLLKQNFLRWKGEKMLQYVHEVESSNFNILGEMWALTQNLTNTLEFLCQKGSIFLTKRRQRAMELGQHCSLMMVNKWGKFQTNTFSCST